MIKMIKTLKQLIHVLWAIEKDLRVIASNTKGLEELNTVSQIDLDEATKVIHATSHDNV